MPDRLHTADEFAGVIRSLYPSLSDATPDNNKLTHAILQVHPEFKDHVIDPLEGSDLLPVNPANAKMVPRPYGEHLGVPPSPIQSEEDPTPIQRRASAKGGPGLAPTTLGEARAGARRQDESSVGQVLASPVTGAMRAGRGISTLSRAMPGAVSPQGPPGGLELAQAGADVLGGGMEAATMLAPEAALAAPWEVIPGLVGGGLAAAGVEHAGQAIGAPAQVTHLVSELTGLIGGVALGKGVGHLAEAPARRAHAEVLDQLQGEDQAFQGDVARETQRGESQMLFDAQRFAEARSDDRSLFNVLQYKNAQARDAGIDQLMLGMAENYRLNQIAEKMKGESASHGSAFETLDAFGQPVPGSEAPPAQLMPGPEPAGLLGPGSPAAFLADASDQVYPGPVDGGNVNAVDVTDPRVADRRPVATSETPPPPLIQTLGEQLSSQLEYQPTGQPRPGESTRVRMADRQEFKDRSRQVTEDAVSEMEGMPHQRGKLVTDTRSGAGESYYTPPVAGSEWYWRIVGKDTSSPPSRAMVTEYLRAYKDAGGEKQLPETIAVAGAKALDLKTPNGFRRAYESWHKNIDRAVKNRTTAMLGYERVAKERAATGEAAREPGAPPEAPQGPPEAPDTRGTVGVSPDSGDPTAIPPPGSSLPLESREAGPPSSEPATGAGAPPAAIDQPRAPEAPPADDLPAFLRDLEADPTAEGGHDVEGEPDVPGGPGRPGQTIAGESVAEASPIQGTPAAPPAALQTAQSERQADLLAEPQPGIEAPPASLAESSPEFGSTRKPRAEVQSLSDLFQHLKGEEGHLIFNVAPGNKEGLRQWLDRHAEEYGGEDWHEQAVTALESGDANLAYRIVTLAAAQSFAQARPRETGERVPVGPSGSKIGEEPFNYQEEYDRASARKQAAEANIRETPGYKKRYAALKEELGGTIPEGIGMNPAGMLTFDNPKWGTKLEASSSDLLLGRNFVHNVIQAADPQDIMLVEGNTDPELRLNRQIADQLVRSMPDEIVDPLLDLLKIPDRAEFAKHFARTVSSWGRGLRMLKDWQDDHWSEIVHIAHVGGGSGEEGGPNGFGDIRSVGGFTKWMGEASADDLQSIGFVLPKNIKEGTKEAETFAKSWYRAREARESRRQALSKTIDELAKDGQPLDRALIAGALEPAGTKSRGTLDAVENTSRAFVISQPVTLIRNMWTQAGRYSVGVLDDALAASYSMLALDPKAADKYLTRAQETASAIGRKGNVSTEMLKTPWLDSLETTYNYTADSLVGLPPEDMRKTIGLLDQFPRRAATYSGGLALEGQGDVKPTSKIPGISRLIDPKVRNFVTVLGRTQEMAFRGAVFDASVRAQLRDAGLDPHEELAGDPSKLIGKLGEKAVDQMIGGAVASALDYTFAAKPYPGSIPGAILHTFSDIPVFSALLRMGFPFPRFNWVSAPRWLYDHSPLAVTDIPLALVGHLTSEGAPFKGRLYRGLEGQKIQAEILPHVASQIGKAEYSAADQLQKFVQAKVDAQQAAKEYKALEKRAASTGMLPEIHQEILDTSRQMLARIKAADDAKAAHKDATTQIRELKKQQRTLEEKLLRIKEIGAPTTAEYFSRMTTGGAMLAAAYLMRSSDDAKDTKWYEYNVEAPGFGKHTLDLRSFAPMVQFLLPADIMHSVHADTDWKGVDQYFKDSKQSKGNLAAWEDAMTRHYHGKYTAKSITAEAITAFLSISPAAGASAGIIDYLTGRSGTVKEGYLQAAASGVLSTVGQFIGRFTTPLRPLADIAATVNPEEAKARIPEDSSDKPHHGAELLGPAVSNIPGLRETIPEKVSPLTGEPIHSVQPLARAFAGLTARDKSRFEDEIAHTGIEYSKMVPRQTGDREFDNAVAKAYHEGLVKYGTKLLDHPKYQGLNPELRRDVLSSAFGGLKQYALSEAGKSLGLDAKATHEKVESPAVKQKLERWKGYLKELQAETERDHPTPVEEPVGANAPPQALSDPSATGFNPQGLRQGINRGGGARPPSPV